MRTINLTLLVLVAISFVRFEAYAERGTADLHASVGKEVSISGVLNARGKVGAWIRVGEASVYIYSKKMNDEASRAMERIYALDGETVVVTGVLHFQASQTSSTPLMSAIAEHYWIEATEMKLEKEKQPNQALQTTSVTCSGFGKVPVSDRHRRGV